jgi:hypothetical protein
MAERVRSYQLGVVIPEGDIQACQIALQTLCNSSVDYQNRFNFAAYRHLHSTERLGNIFQDLLGADP